ncbi:MAG: hypothetical protein M3328_03615 [Chloroflexota bacterium]|nr:hypothetical protein [Chloroflexota bacterium]
MAGEVTDELRATAYHEAGHAVLKVVHHVRLNRVAVVPDEDRGSLGHVAYSVAEAFKHRVQHDTSPDVRARGEVLIISSMAGRLAEARYTGSENLEGAQGDIHHEVDIASYLTGSNEEAELYLAWLYCRARAEVERWWWAIEAVAGELLANKTLSSQDVRAIMREARQAAMKRARHQGSG